MRKKVRRAKKLRPPAVAQRLAAIEQRLSSLEAVAHAPRRVGNFEVWTPLGGARRYRLVGETDWTVC
jgi:hypothetical protein